MADILAVRDDYRARSWAMLIRECSASGLSNREFCRQRGITEKTFYYWLRKLRKSVSEPKLVQLELPQTEQDEMLLIQFRRAELKVPLNTDAEAIAAMLRALQQSC